MIDRLLSPEDVADIMSISKRSAYTVMHRIPHMDSPLRVTERALKDYIEGKMIYPMSIKRRKRA